MMRGGTLYLNGFRPTEKASHEAHELLGSAWRDQAPVDGVSRHNWGPLVVPDGSYFMLGDNLDQSRDSRYWGVVARRHLMARVVFILYSYDSQRSSSHLSFKHVRWYRVGKRVR